MKYYDKNKKVFRDILPKHYRGVSNFDNLPDEELAEHGIISVIDDKPEYDEETQEIVKGDFDAETGVQSWVVQDLNLSALRKAVIKKINTVYQDSLKISPIEFLLQRNADNPDCNNILKEFNNYYLLLNRKRSEYVDAVMAAQGKSAIESVDVDFSDIKKPPLDYDIIIGLIGE